VIGIGSALIFVILLLKLFSCLKGSYNEQEDYINQLFEIGDTETLRKIGAINPFGVRENWSYSPFVCEWLAKKYKETKLQVYFDLQYCIEERSHEIISCGLPAGIFFMVAVIMFAFCSRGITHF
jgi:hypothetical protein